MANKNIIIKETSSADREKIDSVLFALFDEEMKDNNASGSEYTNITFSLDRIPDDLRDLFYKKNHTLWGKICNKEKPYYFSYKHLDINADTNTVTIKIKRIGN